MYYLLFYAMIMPNIFQPRVLLQPFFKNIPVPFNTGPQVTTIIYASGKLLSSGDEHEYILIFDNTCSSTPVATNYNDEPNRNYQFPTKVELFIGEKIRKASA